MSSVSAAAAPVAPRAATTFKRAATATVYRWELRKLVSQKRTYLGLGLAIALPLIFVIVESLHRHHDRGENIFASQITHSGLATPVLMLLFLSVFMLPLIASLVAGDIVAAEDGNGTLKTILTRSVDRGQVFAAKALAAVTYATIAVFLSAGVATGAGLGVGRPAARVRGQRVLPDPADRGRKHRRAAVHGDAQQRRGRRGDRGGDDPDVHSRPDTGP